jgi:hypothetical protein
LILKYKEDSHGEDTMKTLCKWAGVFLLLPVLFNPVFADVPYYNKDCPEENLELESIETFDTNWLDGTVCFIGKRATMAEQAYYYARAYGFDLTYSSDEFWAMVNRGMFVHIKSSPDIPLKVIFGTPFVLPSTARFTRRLAYAYSEGGCGDLYVTGGGRFRTFRNSSEFSVHPAGMAVDIRIRGLSEDCKQLLYRELYQAEADRVADVTEERWPAHLHVVVIPPPVELLAETGANSVATEH